MKTDNNKERWIAEVLGSTEGLERATAPVNMYEKVMAGLNAPKAIRGVSFPLKQWIAAAVLLVAVNVGSIAYFSAQSRQNTGSGDPLSSQVQLEFTYNY